MAMIPIWILTLFVLHASPKVLGYLIPKPAIWSREPFGPDGPWNAVEVSISGQANIALFPGSMWHTFVTTSDYCSFNASITHCSSGSYNKDVVVQEAVRIGADGMINDMPPIQQMLAGIKALGKSRMYLDFLDLLSGPDPMPNQALALIENREHMLEYPGGTRYPIFTGCLSIGAPGPIQVFNETEDWEEPQLNATTIPWRLKWMGRAWSSSYGLHIGSAGPTATMQGSLLFGGYDRNRVLGDVLSLEGDISKPVSLRDISIQVIKGASPFERHPSGSGSDTKAITGLLGKGNSSIASSGLAVVLDPCSPYLTLPKSTCDSIASYLPVSYNASLGLYLWNVSSPRYKSIVASASALAFTLTGGSNTQKVVIRVPFRHLNLTLSPPFTDSPAPYFPCFTGGTGVYTLGRAFFQDAFLGGNWDTGRTFVAQAPGPNIPDRPNQVNIMRDNVTIEASDDNWLHTWEGFWKPLTTGDLSDATQDDGYNPTPSAGGSRGGSTADSDEGQKAAISPETTAAIAVASAVGGMALLGAAVFFWWRRRGKLTQPPDTNSSSTYCFDPDAKRAAGWGPVEAPNHSQPSEAPDTSQPSEVLGSSAGIIGRYEMAGDYPQIIHGIAR
ncbi:hypothetical protein VTI28DRAFT_754 [Corynascus sepedonium]